MNAHQAQLETSPDVRHMSQTDKAALASVLAKAFARDPVMRWIIPSDADYARVSEAYFKMILNQNMRLGVSYTNTDQSGVSLWIGPGSSPSLISQLISISRMFLLFRGNLERAFKLQTLMETYRPRQKFWHLTYIATHPEQQGSGIGSSLLEPMLSHAAAANMPVYLECSNQANLSFYRKHGFRLVDKITPREGPTIWPMCLDA